MNDLATGLCGLMVALVLLAWAVELWGVRHDVVQGLYAKGLPIGSIWLTPDTYWGWVADGGYWHATLPWPRDWRLIDSYWETHE